LTKTPIQTTSNCDASHAMDMHIQGIRVAQWCSVNQIEKVKVKVEKLEKSTQTCQ